MKESFKIVFVVVVYKNLQDLKDFFIHFSVPESKVIVVESIDNEAMTLKFRSIARGYNADFIAVPNKGYGAGNNRGCEYAMEKYNFRYLVISNADVIIKRFDISLLNKYRDAIVAPKIMNIRGVNQNPSAPYKPSRVMERVKLWIYKGNHTRLIWVVFAINRMKKMAFYCNTWISRKIFSAHGAFVIIPYPVLTLLYPLYNEEMFLFNEEEHLGMLASSKGIKTYYEPRIEVLHKEDGSIRLSTINEFEKLKQSFIAFYRYWNQASVGMDVPRRFLRGRGDRRDQTPGAVKPLTCVEEQGKLNKK